MECCFYQFLLPVALQVCFGLHPILGRWLSKRLRKALGIRRHDMVQFCLTVVPMGWSWAVWFIQMALVHNVSLSAEAKLSGAVAQVVTVQQYVGTGRLGLFLDAELFTSTTSLPSPSPASALQA